MKKARLEKLKVTSFITQFEKSTQQKIKSGAALVAAPISDTKTGHDPISFKDGCTNLADCKVKEYRN